MEPRNRTPRTGLLLALLFFVGILTADGQRVRGELHIEVRDPQGATLAADAEISSEANQFRRTFAIGSDGRYVVQGLSFGRYRLSLRAKGFARRIELIEIRSEVPVSLPVTMTLATVSTEVEVRDSATLVDPARTGAAYSIGQRVIGEQLSTQPGRDLAGLVDQEPGWLFEANGVLHPRGSEYDVQYVVDGVPLTQNRSPAFAPALDADTVESMRVLTASFPAEYGRKLGGVIEVSTEKNLPTGLHGQINLSGGSFATVNGSAAISYASQRNRFALSGDGFHTDRYLDPPVLANYTNQGNAGGFSASYERDFSDRTAGIAKAMLAETSPGTMAVMTGRSASITYSTRSARA